MTISTITIKKAKNGYGSFMGTFKFNFGKGMELTEFIKRLKLYKQSK